MLNPSFPKSAITFNVQSYVAPKDIAQNTLAGNQSFDAGEELRLQNVYGEEIWLKLARSGISPEYFRSLSVLEVCGGGGFLTFHLLQKCAPKMLTVNDISANELEKSRQLISTHYAEASVEYVLGDMHQVSFKNKFDLIIGNSFLHHFHDVPKVLSKFHSLLNEGGSFISLHEPTPMSTVVESGKLMAYPLAVFAPEWVNEIARVRFKGKPSATDIWMFEPRELQRVAKQAGFSTVRLHAWHLLRSFVVQKYNLHLCAEKLELSANEERLLNRAIRIDSILNKFLSTRFFGSVSLVCKKI